MGQAFHRKQISIDRSRTRGIGIKYMNVVPPVVRELTAEQIAARAAETHQQAVLDKQRQFRQQNVDAVVEIARKMLDHWKKISDYHDQRLITFAGWTTSNYCALPVEKDVARFYADKIQRHKRQVDRPLSLEELDEIIEASCQPNVPTEQVVEEATKAVRYVAQACTDFDGIDAARLIEALSRRALRAKQNNSSLDSAFDFVSKHMGLMFQKMEPTR